ncbi:MAG: (E)-4-hydroxy-3-methylbut-2-enyl-diphosphate synthase [Flavobacteriales bacterium]
MENYYIPSFSSLNRYKSREVHIGNVAIGGANPIRIQSMTTTDTMDTEATVKECIELIEAGCEIVRITAPGKREAENLQNIKAALRSKGYDTPLVADIHFTPIAAEIAATIVEKVRVNPGNYVDNKKFKSLTFTEESYQKEIDKIKKRFSPLIEICKKHNTAMRIGTNHGSLSDRILSQYGDTPKGMVESAMEFLRICKELDYHDVVLSMKASNTIIMVQAYRLLIVEMEKEGMNYPLHLGVTEAGDGDDGRVKSAVGMGTLLLDGIGDTIRVSLTEAPVFEIPVAQEMLNTLENKKLTNSVPEFQNELPYSPYAFSRRKSLQRAKIGSAGVPVVISDLSLMKKTTVKTLEALDFRYKADDDKWHIGDQAPDYIFDEKDWTFSPAGLSPKIDNNTNQNLKVWASAEAYQQAELKAKVINFVKVKASQLECCVLFQDDPTVVWLLSSDETNPLIETRRWLIELDQKNQLKHSVLIDYQQSTSGKLQEQMIASAYMGALFVDGRVDGIWMRATEESKLNELNALAFGILQASRARSSKTEYISCPSCGRTLFDLQETTAKVRSATEHLKGLKIGIMGCIVNGPGEMADADYGYVGTGPGKITLYKGQEVQKRNIPSDLAVNQLIELIKSHGDWKEKEL